MNKAKNKLTAAYVIAQISLVLLSWALESMTWVHGFIIWSILGIWYVMVTSQPKLTIPAIGLGMAYLIAVPNPSPWVYIMISPVVFVLCEVLKMREVK